MKATPLAATPRRRLLLAAPFLSLVALTALPALGRAAPPDLLPRSALFSDPPRHYPQVSPNGARLGWLEPDERGILQIRIGALDGGKAVTAEARPVRRWRWSADGHEALFLQDALGEENDHLYSVAVRS